MWVAALLGWLTATLSPAQWNAVKTLSCLIGAYEKLTRQALAQECPLEPQRSTRLVPHLRLVTIEPQNRAWKQLKSSAVLLVSISLKARARSLFMARVPLSWPNPEKLSLPKMTV